MGQACAVHSPAQSPYVPGDLRWAAHFLGRHLIPSHSLEVIQMSQMSSQSFFFFELLTDPTVN